MALLLEARSAFSTDDRDKLFAVLELSKQDDVTSGFVPQCSVAVDDVFIRFTQYHIETTGNLDILGAVEDHSDRLKKRLTSWVPDWEVHQPTIPMSLVESSTSWDASNRSHNALCVSFSDDNRILTASSVTIDTIHHVGDSFLKYVPLPGTARDWYPHLKTDLAKEMMHNASDFLMQQRYRQWERIARNNRKTTIDTSSAEGEDTDMASAFIRTLIADNTTLISSAEMPVDSNVQSTRLEKIYASWRKYWIPASQFQGIYITSYTSATPAGVLTGQQKTLRTRGKWWFATASV